MELLLSRIQSIEACLSKLIQMSKLRSADKLP